MSIFTRIIRGEIPSYKLFEDPHVFAFLDINPISHGHTLVIPKEAKAHLHELSDEGAAAIMAGLGCGVLASTDAAQAMRTVDSVHLPAITGEQRGIRRSDWRDAVGQVMACGRSAASSHKTSDREAG